MTGHFIQQFKVVRRQPVCTTLLHPPGRDLKIKLSKNMLTLLPLQKLFVSVSANQLPFNWHRYLAIGMIGY